MVANFKRLSATKRRWRDVARLPVLPRSLGTVDVQMALEEDVVRAKWVRVGTETGTNKTCTATVLLHQRTPRTRRD